MIPHTGVTLPFISYGGSSISSTFFLLAIVQGITILSRKREREEMKLRDMKEEILETQATLADLEGEEDPELIEAFESEEYDRNMEAYLNEKYDVHEAPPEKKAKNKKNNTKKRGQKQAKPSKQKNGTVAFVTVFATHSVAFLLLAVYLIHVIVGADARILNNSYKN